MFDRIEPLTSFLMPGNHSKCLYGINLLFHVLRVWHGDLSNHEEKGKIQKVKIAPEETPRAMNSVGCLHYYILNFPMWRITY